MLTIAFFVVDFTASYWALLDRDWIHTNAYISYLLHQVMLIWNGNEVKIIWADEDPFQAHNDMIDACYYYTGLGPPKMQPGARSKKERCALLTEAEEKQLNRRHWSLKLGLTSSQNHYLLLLKRSVMIDPLVNEKVAVAAAARSKFQM